MKATQPVKLTLFLVALPFISVSVFAASDAEQVSELLITGTQFPTSTNRFSSPYTILSAAEIEQTNSVSVVNLLGNYEGIHITQPGGSSGVASLFLRGGEANFTTILLDGVKLNNPNNTRGGSFDFATLSLAEFDTVEIIRGPQSAIYGSDALSGVVNFISRRNIEPGAKLIVEAGEDELNRASLSGAVKVAENHRLTGGISTYDDGEVVPGNGYKLTSGWTTFSGNLGDGATEYRINLRASDAEKSAFPEDSGGYELAIFRQLDDSEFEDFTSSMTLSHQFNESWESQVLLSHYERDDFSVSGGVAPGLRGEVPANSFDSQLQRSYLQFSNRFTAQNYDISIGGDFQIEKGSATGFVEFAPGFSVPSDFDIERETVGFYVAANFNLLDNWQFLTSLRYDKPDNTSSQVSPSLGIIASFFDGRTSLRANFSEGFKLPSFFALASPLVGNPELKQESVKTFDIGLTQQLSQSLSLELTLFDSNYKDLIDFDSEAFINVNRSAVDIRGAEAAVRWTLSDKTQLRAHTTYTDIDLQPSGKLRQRPNFRGGITINHQPSDKVSLHGNLLHVGESYDSSIPTAGLDLDSYLRLDLSMSWRVSTRFRVAAAIDNALDEDYSEAIGFPAVGRRARVSLSLEL